MKKNLILVALLLCVFSFSCKEEEKFTAPDYVLKKWSRSTQTVNYNSYSECEANPKSLPVFREMFKNYYYDDMTVTGLEDYDPEDIKKDPDDLSYNHRLVYFECQQVDRKSKKIIRNVKGDVLFVKYIEGKNKKKGWVMSNRTMTRFNIDR